MTVEQVRACFPTLQSGFAYLENAGGSQVPKLVADAVREHMLTDYVQLGAGYPQADAATAMVDDAHAFMAEFVNAGSVGKVVLGPSSTALINLIAGAYGDTLHEGDEVIIAQSNHEANVGAWERLERRGAKVKIWPIDPQTFRCELDVLGWLLTERTRIVTMPHVSNIVGQIEDVREVCQMAHAVGARVCADGVAYAPHRAVDVQELDVDWYVFSAYKIYGPHMAVLYGKQEAFDELVGPNHKFIAKDAIPHKWELGGVSHEACAGLVALRGYHGFLAGEPYSGRATIERAHDVIQSLESPLDAWLRSWLGSRSDLRVIGPTVASEASVGTVSFVHRSIPSDEIAAMVNRSGMGIRNGHMYAVRLLEGLGIPTEPGVVRISLVHYNTLAEVDRVIAVLEEIFAAND